jgi:MFS family permease
MVGQHKKFSSALTGRAMTSERWRIAVAGVLLQMALGSVYAWSVFRTPLATQFGWSIPQITLTFTITILALSCAAFAGGLWLNRSGPRVVAVTGGVLYGLGVMLASFTERIEWLYVTYGLLGGIGLGLGYIVPVTVLVKWFPDRRGLITGIRGGRFRRRRAGNGANCHRAHRKSWRAVHVRMARTCLSSCGSASRLVHAQSS